MLLPYPHCCYFCVWGDIRQESIEGWADSNYLQKKKANSEESALLVIVNCLVFIDVQKPECVYSSLPREQHCHAR
jgi:hypothetical protein